jgi:hypothetical protein
MQLCPLPAVVAALLALTPNLALPARGSVATAQPGSRGGNALHGGTIMTGADGTVTLSRAAESGTVSTQSDQER